MRLKLKRKLFPNKPLKLAEVSNNMINLNTYLSSDNES